MVHTVRKKFDVPVSSVVFVNVTVKNVALKLKNSFLSNKLSSAFSAATAQVFIAKNWIYFNC